MKGSDFIFDCDHLLYHKCQKINFKCDGSYINSPEWIKSKKETINPISKNYNKWFQYTTKATLNNEKICGNPERISKIKTFVSIYGWEGINIKKFIERIT